ncbi:MULTISPECIES: ATP-binding cassette domain-containing protein [unclassified Thiocapsa]|uniref:ATP-binding cassette domain-containing protein n=1 Tax=unclassified Thiocapsa TaxID=2641286 RepID=UPI0035B3BD81
MTDTLIKVEGVSKKFCRRLKKSLWYGMQDLGNELRGRHHSGDGELRPDEFWAVEDVSFELRRGECPGLIGRNGTGKTTLLRMLNGLIKPDAGRTRQALSFEALAAVAARRRPASASADRGCLRSAVRSGGVNQASASTAGALN